ncbi:MAG: SHOCT domain-containing protein, partial [Sphingopyxis sp.]
QVEKLHKLLTMGAISQEEFDAKKAELLGRVR